jgi:glycosyltransferase involved in cell wall biosynthesis
LIDQFSETSQSLAQDVKRSAAPATAPVAFDQSADSGSAALDLSDLRIAVLIPCYNEEASIALVVRDFRAVLPGAAIYVYDNNSKDRTVELARASGAVVRTEPLQGKGNVVRRMFADVEADVYVLVDGDDTYHAPSAPLLISKLVSEQLDMVNGARVTEIVEAYRPGHRFGNMVLTGIVANIFGNRVADMLSGYRVFSRRFVKSFPALSGGFEIETELTVHALELRMPMSDVETPYKDRPPGSTSKLRTYYDGFRILKLILVLVKEERPLQFFSLLSTMLAVIAIILAGPVLMTFLQTGLVPRLPTAVLSTGLMLLAFLSLTCGLILETVTRGRREMKRMQYLSIPAPTRIMRAETVKRIGAETSDALLQKRGSGLVG